MNLNCNKKNKPIKFLLIFLIKLFLIDITQTKTFGTILFHKHPVGDVIKCNSIIISYLKFTIKHDHIEYMVTQFNSIVN